LLEQGKREAMLTTRQRLRSEAAIQDECQSAQSKDSSNRCQFAICDQRHCYNPCQKNGSLQVTPTYRHGLYLYLLWYDAVWQGEEEEVWLSVFLFSSRHHDQPQGIVFTKKINDSDFLVCFTTSE
jgi:hypothetical protein